MPFKSLHYCWNQNGRSWLKCFAHQKVTGLGLEPGHELFCSANPVKFWWLSFGEPSEFDSTFAHQNLAGFVLQNNSYRSTMALPQRLFLQNKSYHGDASYRWDVVEVLFWVWCSEVNCILTTFESDAFSPIFIIESPLELCWNGTTRNGHDEIWRGEGWMAMCYRSERRLLMAPIIARTQQLFTRGSLISQFRDCIRFDFALERLGVIELPWNLSRWFADAKTAMIASNGRVKTRTILRIARSR